MSKVEYYKKVKVAELNYKSVTKNRKGAPVVYIGRSKDRDSNCKVQLNLPVDPKLTCPFGLSIYDAEAGGRQSLDISMQDPALVQFWKDIDQRNVDTAIERKADWFKAGTTDDQIRAMYYPLLQFDTTGKGYDPKLHCKANTEPGNRQLRVLNMTADGKKWVMGDTNDLKKKFCKVMAIVEIGNVWFQKLQFGMTVLACDVMIFPEDDRKEFEFDWGESEAPEHDAVSKAAPEVTSDAAPDEPEEGEIVGEPSDEDNSPAEDEEEAPAQKKGKRSGGAAASMLIEGLEPAKKRSKRT